jgi:AcrR family transcriptional regulator
MSPQPSNREALLEGALRCLERLPPQQVTARAIAAESGANLASIRYHFGSKDELVSEAAILGLDRWLEEIAASMRPAGDDPASRLTAAAEAVEQSRSRHAGLAGSYVTALAKAMHDPSLRGRLARGFRDARPAVAAVLGLGEGPAASDAAGLALALFHGLLYQALLDPGLSIPGERLARALERLEPGPA